MVNKLCYLANIDFQLVVANNRHLFKIGSYIKVVSYFLFRIFSSVTNQDRQLFQYRLLIQPVRYSKGIQKTHSNGIKRHPKSIERIFLLCTMYLILNYNMQLFYSCNFCRLACKSDVSCIFSQ